MIKKVDMVTLVQRWPNVVHPTPTIQPFTNSKGKPGGTVRLLTKKNVVLGAIVVLLIVGIIAAVVSLLTLGQDRDKKLQNQDCPNVLSPGMSYPAVGKTGIQGRQFLVCFTENHPNARNQNKTIYILSDEEFEFVLISKFLDSPQLNTEVKTQSINFNKEINVINTIALSSFQVEQKALLIETTEDVSVIIIDNYIHTSDSTTILPLKSLSNSYIISTAKAKSTIVKSSQFAIASPQNGTIIRIKFHFDPDSPIIINDTTYRNGSEMTLVLDELQTYQIQHWADMSGTVINATSPLAVFAGSNCKIIPFINSTEAQSCGKLDEQIPPIDRLDKMYIVPPNFNRNGTFLKIVSPFENRLTYKIGNKQTEKTLNPSGYLEIYFLNDEVVVIDSEKSVLVTSFATGSYVTGDPYMITVPGIRQYTDKYLVEIPENYKESYICLMVEEKSLHNLVLNGTEIIQFLNDTKFNATLTIRDINFVVLILQVSGGMLDIKSSNTAAFGLVVYGHRQEDGHGFAGKAVLPDICVHSYE
ncbi:IgGFc-binding protein-like [Saccostrea echinata]|uniref:IgGFc-binding protein-like n=1 Tax=Saccostrea echinata TaxID=191078 RepID=UPI002A8149BC|nr:IgGFc-binding protein-like [Saccostrea echinata]